MQVHYLVGSSMVYLILHTQYSPVFANNHHGDGHIAVWLPAGPGLQAALIEEAPDTYFRPPYVGVAGWVGVELSRVDDDQLGATKSQSAPVGWVTSGRLLWARCCRT